MSTLEEIDDAFCEGKTEEEIKEAIAAAIAEENMSKLERMRRDNPAIQEAWDQIKTIRALTEKNEDVEDTRPAWERHYADIVNGVETNNEALREAWNRYYVIKTLMNK